jgi:hypothetical protein
MRLALGVSYRGQAYHGWQSQPSTAARCRTCWKRRSRAFAAEPVRHRCAPAAPTAACMRSIRSCIMDTRAAARHVCVGARHQSLSCRSDVAVQWCQPVGRHFHARNSARGRRYRFHGAAVGGAAGAGTRSGGLGLSNHCMPMPCAQAAALLVGEHDFSSFRAAGLPVTHTGEDRASPSQISQRGAPTGALTSTPTLSCTTWCATSWAAWWSVQRPPAAALGGRGAGRTQTADVAAPTFAARRAVLSAARTTMRRWNCRPFRRTTGCPGFGLPLTL